MLWLLVKVFEKWRIVVFVYVYCVSRGCVVGIATRYGLDGPGIESRCGRDFQHPFRPALGPPPSLLYNGCRVSFPGGKAAVACRWPPIPSSAEVKERVEIYLSSPSGPSWPVLGWTLPLPLPLYMYIVILWVSARYIHVDICGFQYTGETCHLNIIFGKWRQ